MTKFKKITLLGILVLYMFSDAKAQVNQSPQIKIALSPVVFNKSHTYSLHVNTSYRFSGLLSTLYYKPLGRGFGINTGIGVGVLPNIDFTISSYTTQTNPELIESYYSENSFKDETSVDWLITVPLTLQKTIKSNCSCTNFAFEFGFQYNRLMTSAKSDWSFEDGYVVDGVSHEEVSFNYEVEATHPAHQFGFVLKFGFVNTLKNNNTLNINLVGHLADYRSVTTGAYEFSNLGRSNSWWLGQQVEYVGLELSYGISQNKKQRK